MSLFERKCPVCNGPIVGRRDRRTCSDRCRTALNRAKTDAGAVTETVGAVTATVGAVTASWAAGEPRGDLGHWTSEEPSIWR